MLRREDNVRLILEYALEGEGVRDHLAFPCALGPITGVEEIWAGGDGRVIEVAFQASGSMRVDGG